MPKVEVANALDLTDYQTRFIGDLSNVLGASHENENIHLTFTSAAELASQEESIGREASIIEACFRLIRTSSQDDYKKSSVRWSATEKRREMRLPDMRYLLLWQRDLVERNTPMNTADQGRAAHGQGSLRGFVSFMITYEDGFEVAYIYEIHISEELRGKGVGAKLMSIIYDVARKAGLSKVMLTVFMSNYTARLFYERIGYTLDDYSPQPRKLRNGIVKEPDYLILSKSVTVDSNLKRVKTEK